MSLVSVSEEKSLHSRVIALPQVLLPICEALQ